MCGCWRTDTGPGWIIAVVVTDLLRLKPGIFRGSEVTWRHLAASCAVPLVLPQVRIDGRWYSDGGLLNPLPVYAAVELGATEILGSARSAGDTLACAKPFALADSGPSSGSTRPCLRA